MSNKRSLVFSSPNKSDKSEVLFSADSDFKFKQDIDWSSGMLITVPHHGSEENSFAYSRFRNETNGLLKKISWVRSDKRFRKRPGQSFRSAIGTKYCTICSNSTLPKQNVELITTNVEWVPRTPSVRKCSC